MRDSRWSELVEVIVQEMYVEGGDKAIYMCYRGEGSAMLTMAERHPEVFASIPGEWAHEPRLPWFHGGLANSASLGGFKRMPQVWATREHPGLQDATRAYVFCPGFVDLALHLAVNSMIFPLFAVEFAQV